MITRQSISLALGSMLVATACGGGGGGGGGSPPSSNVTPGSLAAITEDGRLITFDTGTPGEIRTSTVVQNLAAGEKIVGLDARASTGELVAVSDQSRLYRIDANTGAATPVGLTAFFPPLTPGSIALQDDPAQDDVRIVDSADRSIHLSEQTGLISSEDAHVQYAAGDAAAGNDPMLAAIAFTDAHPFASQTTMYGIDSLQGTLVRIGDVGGTPQLSTSGQLHTVGALGITTDEHVGFDVTPDGGALLSATSPGATQSDLYTLDLATGQTHPIGTIASGSPVRALTWRGASAPRVFGITDQNTLVTFRPGAPTTMLSSVAVSGLVGGEHLVAIDQRVTDGMLYAISDGSRLYVLDANTGEATALGAGFSVGLSGTAFDLDFTPEFGAARVVDDADQNLRVNPLDGSIGGVDQPLAYGPADIEFGLDPGIVAAAFDNNEFGAGGSTMFAIDATADTLVRIGSIGGAPNLPSTGALTTIGQLGVNVGLRCGLDIDAHGVAFAAFDLGVVSNLCTIDLATGAVRDIGPIGGSARVIDIAVELPGTPTVYGVDDTNTLVSFLAGEPRALQSSQAISGLDAGESIVAIDFRPVSGELLGTSDQNRVFRIDRTTGIATPLGIAFAPAPTGTRTSADVDPATDELRVVSDGDSNLRVSTTSGAMIGVDPNLAYAGGDPNFGHDPGVVSIAHTMGFAGATSTALYDIDATNDVLVRQGPFSGPSSGQLRTIGPLGVDLSGEVGFDIDSRGVALVSRSVGAHTLFRLDLATGMLFPLGAIGGEALRDIAILPR